MFWNKKPTAYVYRFCRDGSVIRKKYTEVNSMFDVYVDAHKDGPSEDLIVIATHVLSNYDRQSYLALF